MTHSTNHFIGQYHLETDLGTNRFQGNELYKVACVHIGVVKVANLIRSGFVDLLHQNLIKLLGLLTACLLGNVGWSQLPTEEPAARTDTAARRPNILFFLVDDLGKYDLGCEGSTFYETPNIDRLAARSCRFDNAYSACQVCSPSRVAIQTGRHPARVPITDYINPNGANQPKQWQRNTRLLPAEFELQLPLAEQTIAEALKPLGYHSYFAGKWHLGGEGYLPTDQGYDINVGGDEFGTPPGGYFSPYRNRRLADGPVGEQLPLRLAQETTDYIRSRANQSTPFFAMLSFYSVHAPIQTTQGSWSKYRDKAEQMGLATVAPRFIFDRTQEVRQTQDSPLYAGMMESLDNAVGHVLDSLQQTGQADNTVVIFTSDNGGVSSGDGYATAALPLRGGKGRQWEGGIRQPLYIHLPNQQTETRSQVLTTGTDLLPTLLELAGAGEKQPTSEPKQSAIATPRFDGRSLVPTLAGQEMEARPLFWHYPHYGNQGGEPSSIIRDQAWKLIHYYEDGRNELYNLEEDLGEKNDLAATQEAQTERLSAQLKSWLVGMQARYPTPNPRYNAAAASLELERARNVRMPEREAEQAAMFLPSYEPQGGWWQFRGKR